MSEKELPKAAFEKLQEMVAFDSAERENGGEGLNKATGEVWQRCDTASAGVELKYLLEAGLVEQKTRYKSQTSQQYTVTLDGLSYFDDEIDLPSVSDASPKRAGFAKELAREVAHGFGEGAGKATASTIATGIQNQ